MREYLKTHPQTNKNRPFTLDDRIKINLRQILIQLGFWGPDDVRETTRRICG